MRFLRLTMLFSWIFLTASSAFAAEATRFNLVGGTYVGAPEVFFMDTYRKIFCLDSGCSNRIQQLQANPTNGEFSYLGTVVNGAQIIDQDGKFTTSDRVFYQERPSANYNATNLFSSRQQITLSLTGVTGISPNPIIFKPGIGWVDDKDNLFTKISPLPKMTGKRFLGFSTRSDPKTSDALTVIDSSGNMLSVAESLTGSWDLFPVWEDDSVNCTAGQYLPINSYSCTQCPANSWCPGGNFKTNESTTQGINACEAGLISDAGSSNVEACHTALPDSVICPAGEYLPVDSEVCITCLKDNWCPGGNFQINNSEIQGLNPCEEGLLSDAGSSKVEACHSALPDSVICPAGQYLPINSYSCTQCPANSWCPGGNFKTNESTTQGINPCEEGLFSDAGSSNIEACMTPPPEVSCPAGEYLPVDSEVCIKCLKDNWCPGGTYQINQSTSQGIKPCEAEYTSEPGSSDIKDCQMPPIVQIPETTTCPAGQYLPANSSSCNQCPANSWCPGGIFKTNNSEIQGLNPCEEGLLSDAGSSKVEACHSALPDSVICPAGQYLPINSYSCTQCPANSWCPGGNFKTNESTTQGINPCEEGLFSDAGSSNIEACMTPPPEVSCPAGEYLPVDSEVCIKCLKDNWCPGGTYQINQSTSQGIKPCEAEYTSEPGSSDIKDCQMPPPETTTCPAGQYLPANSSSCNQCPANSWCPGGIFKTNDPTNQGITACSNSGVSGTGSSAIGSCYKTGLVLSVPNGSGTQTCYWGTVGYTSGCFNYSVTKCIAGYYWAGDNAQCDEVGIGYFSSERNINRQECPTLANNNLQGTTDTTTSADSSSCFIQVPFVSDENGMGTMRCVFNTKTLYGKAEIYEKNANKFPTAPAPDDGQCKNLGINFCFGGFFLESPDNTYCSPIENGNFSQRPDLNKYLEQDCIENPTGCADQYGYDLSKPEEKLGQTACPDPYVNSEDQRDNITTCFKNCSVISVANSASVTAVSTKINYGAQDTTCKFNVTCQSGFQPSGNGTATPSCTDVPPETTTCTAGQYLPANSSSCSQCTANSWCAGGTYEINQSANQGITACANSGISVAGSSAISSCYKTGLVLSVPNGSGTQTCYWGTVGYTSGCFNYSVTKCIAGYYWAGDNAQCDEVGIGYFSSERNINRQECPTLANNNLQGTTDTTTSADSSSCFIQVPFVSDENGMGTMRCVFNTKTLYGKAEIYEKNANKFPTAPAPDDGQCKNLGINFCFGGFFLESPDNTYCSPIENGNFSQRPDLNKYLEQDCIENPTGCADQYGYDLSKPEEKLGQTACPDPYVNSEDQRDNITTCFKNCSVISVANSASVTAVSTKINYGAQDTTCKFNVTCQSGFQPSGNGTATPSCTDIPPETTTCPAGQYLPANSSSCSQCTANSWCAGGTYEINQSANQGITACGGSLISNTGSSNSGDCKEPAPANTTCAAGQYLPANTASCSGCPANSWCAGGTYQINQSANQGITACDTGLISDAGSSSAEACHTNTPTCAAGEYLPANSDSCIQCPENSWCAGGTYEIKSTNQGIIACNTGFISAPGSSNLKNCQKTCEAGEYLHFNGTCSICHVNYWCSGGTFSPELTHQGDIPCGNGLVSDAGSSSIEACHTPTTTTTCAAGQYVLANGSSCSQCLAHSWCAGGTYQTNQSTNQGITACGASFVSEPGSSSIDACQPRTITCTPGQYMAADTYYCLQCPWNSWCPGGTYQMYQSTDQGINDCGAAWYSTIGSSSIEDCLPRTIPCNPGQYLPANSGFCTQCTANSWCGGGTYQTYQSTNQGITACGAGLISNTGSSSSTACKAPAAETTTCAAGQYLPANQSSCSQCLANSWCGGGTYQTYQSTNQGITACDTGLISNAGSSSSTACKAPAAETTTCAAGQYLPANQSSCSQCLANSWCAGGTYQINQSANQGITACGAGLISNTGSSSSSACQTPAPETKTCAAGQYLPANQSSCSQCLANSWCAGGTYEVNQSTNQGITACGTGMISDAGSSVIGSCRTPAPETKTCAAGQYLPANSSSCSQCTANSWCAGGTYPINQSTNQGITACGTGMISDAGSSAIGACQTPTTTCAAGQYLPANTLICTTCVAGNYCTGGIFSKSTSIQGLAACPNGGTSSAQSPAASSCYKACSSAGMSILNSTSITPVAEKVYWTSSAYPICNFNIVCLSGYSLVNNSGTLSCVLDAVVCNTDPNASAFNANCESTKCKFGYHLENKKCVSNRMACPLTNGTGVKEWMSDNITGGKWTQCTADSCEAGYTSDRSLTNEKKPCGVCRNMRNASGEIVVSSWKNTNCEIATCMYQGELYRLSNNECIPICDINGREDDTGTMRWDSISKKCERTCKPGFTGW